MWMCCALTSQTSHKHNGLIQPKDFHMCPYTWIGPDLVYIQAITLALAPKHHQSKKYKYYTRELQLRWLLWVEVFSDLKLHFRIRKLAVKKLRNKVATYSYETLPVIPSVQCYNLPSPSPARLISKSWQVRTN